MLYALYKLTYITVLYLHQMQYKSIKKQQAPTT